MNKNIQGDFQICIRVPLKPDVWEIYDSKTVISTLQISVVLNMTKFILGEFTKGLKLMKVVAISR